MNDDRTGSTPSNRTQAQNEPGTTQPARISQNGPLLVGRNLLSFDKSPENDPSELIKHRYLCRGGGLLLCGPTGIGKSSLALQLPMLWALGRGDFGLYPNGKLRTLIIQAENDDGDIAEFRDGVCAGYNFTSSEMRAVSDNVIIYRERRKRGKPFFKEIAHPLVEHTQPDLVVMDHGLAYFPGKANEQEQVGVFLREMVDPLVEKANCGICVAHHTPKPSQDKRSVWANGDFAYAGFGSVEWAGWARAVLTMRTIKHGVFELMAPKRGERLNWKDENGNKTGSMFIAHCEDKICWRKATPEEVSPTQNKGKYTADDLFDVLDSAEGGLRAAQWNSIAKDDLGMSKRTAEALRAVLHKDHRVWYEPKTRLWRPF